MPSFVVADEPVERLRGIGERVAVPTPAIGRDRAPRIRPASPSGSGSGLLGDCAPICEP